ncbi:MAG: efflux RND transporter periplasmic adaptor subunit [Magnetococcales bacterium]|nr:efflux RND transporter periplasmic adaptor subunit [Magnetococcales bacterium]
MNQANHAAIDHWQTLLKEEEAAPCAAAWLALMSERVGDLAEAVLVLGPANVGPFRPLALWPPGQSACSRDLATACEQAMDLRLPVSRSAPQGAILVLPLLRERDVHGVVGLHFVTQAVPFHARGWVTWGMGWIFDRLLHPADHASQPLPERLLVFLNLMLSVLAVEKFADACQTAVTEAATQLGCDRVSLGFGERDQVRFVALSHAVEFARRIDLVHGLEAAMNEAADQGCTLTHIPAEATATAPQPARELAQLARRFDNRAIIATPFFVATDAYGVFLFEWAEDDLDPATRQMAEGIPPILGRVLLDKRAQQLPWRKKLRKHLGHALHRLFGPRHAGYKAFVLLTLLATLFFYQAVGLYRVSAHAALEGEIRRVIVAPYDGFIASAPVRAGHIVREGETLATLDDRDLRLEAARWISQEVQYQKQAHDAEAKHDLAQMQIATAQIRQATAQRNLLESSVQRAHVVAPFAGIITSGDLSQHLGGTVKKGQTLFEIAPLDSYRVVLEIAEADIADIREGEEGELVVTAMPGLPLPFTLSLVTPVANASEGHTSFRAEATLHQGESRLRPGMEGIAKVNIGTRRLIWIWTHHLFDWLRLQLWNWFGW